MNIPCRVMQDLDNFFSQQDAAEKALALSVADKKQEVKDLAERLIKGSPVRIVKYWATNELLKFSDVVEEAINNESFESASMEFCKGNTGALAEIYRKEAQYMVARALHSKAEAEDWGFKP